MLLSLFLFPFALCHVASAEKPLPRGNHKQTQPRALAELHNVILKGRADHSSLISLRPRMSIDAQPLEPRAHTAQSSAAAVKRTLLGARQTCQPGYGYCSASGRCCPDDGNGRCCDDGTCVDSGQDCCADGGACYANQKCCIGGCAPEGSQCCADGDYHCNNGSTCCGNGKCAPKGGECCADGSVCDSGLLCVLYDSIQTCCVDLSCSEYTGGSSGWIRKL